MSSLPIHHITPEEYLERERRAEQKSEYFGGEMFAMSGGTLNHAVIGANLVAQFDRLLGDGPCMAIGSDLRVLVDATGLYTYPDVVVVCGEPQLLDQQEDVLKNPKVIIEVLSASTEMYDRGKKWEHYQQIASLCEYMLVSQDQPRVELFTRESSTDDWRYHSYAGIEAVAVIPTLGCQLPLAGIYRRVRFGTVADDTAEPPVTDSP